MISRSLSILSAILFSMVVACTKGQPAASVGVEQLSQNSNVAVGSPHLNRRTPERDSFDVDGYVLGKDDCYNAAKKAQASQERPLGWIVARDPTWVEVLDQSELKVINRVYGIDTAESKALEEINTLRKKFGYSAAKSLHPFDICPREGGSYIEPCPIEFYTSQSCFVCAPNGKIVRYSKRVLAAFDSAIQALKAKYGPPIQEWDEVQQIQGGLMDVYYQWIKQKWAVFRADGADIFVHSSSAVSPKTGIPTKVNPAAFNDAAMNAYFEIAYILSPEPWTHLEQIKNLPAALQTIYGKIADQKAKTIKTQLDRL